MAESSDELVDYIVKALVPLYAGAAIGICVLVAYLLFVIISLCCKCCSSKRGFCQRPQPLTYKQRLPFILMVLLPALLGVIGGILVLSGGPKLVGTFRVLLQHGGVSVVQL